MSTSTPSTHIPLDFLPCANNKLGNVCGKKGTIHCSGCRLVAYCSKKCQKAHLGTHKSFCKGSFLYSQWFPAHLREQRAPAFMGGPSQRTFGVDSGLSVRVPWGNMPPVDVLNLPLNEGTLRLDRDLGLAFPGCGNLRNMIATVNSLPLEYTGSLKILINDASSFLIMHMLLLLLIFANVANESEAAECGLHFWFSIFLPAKCGDPSCFPDIAKRCEDLLRTRSASLSPTALLSVMVSDDSQALFEKMQKSPRTAEQTRFAFAAIMTAMERVDYRDRAVQSLEPPHRLAVLDWKRRGVMLPYGASQEHMTFPNRWLFTKEGELAFKDSSSPLSQWDISAAIDSGKRHGAAMEDIVGCVYFHIYDHFLSFVQRLRRFNLSITVMQGDAATLGGLLQKPYAGSLFPRSRYNTVAFDRIYTTNLADEIYLGLEGVLQNWAPLLNQDNPYATLICMFYNWSMFHDGVRVEDINPDTEEGGRKLNELFEIMKELYPQHCTAPAKLQSKFRFNEMHTMASGMMERTYLVNDTFPTLKEYLANKRADQVAQGLGLKMRRVNSIVPPRLGVPVGYPMAALPEVYEDDRAYLQKLLGGQYMIERYVEWVRS